MFKSEVAKTLNCSEKTVYRYVREGRLSVKYEKIPGASGKPKAVFSEQEVLRLKEELNTPVYLSIPEVVSDIVQKDSLNSRNWECIEQSLEAWKYSQYLASLKQKLLLTTLEAAAVSGLSVSAIRRAIREDLLPVLRFGKRYKISQERLEIFIKSLEEGY